MSHYIISQAIEILIPSTVSGLSAHTDIGLFDNGDDTFSLKWSEVTLVGTGLTDLWTAGIIAPNGIGDIKKGERDCLRQGGCPEKYSGLSLIVLNNNQLILQLKELGITLNGMIAKLYTFEGTEADHGSHAITMDFRGTCSYEENTSWDEKLWRIEIKNNRYQRNAFIGTMINNDATNGNYPDAEDNQNNRIIPITYGNHLYDYPAKLIRSSSKETQYYNSMNKTAYSKYCTPEDQYIFPVIANYFGITENGSKTITVGYTGCFNVGDHITVYTGFPDGADKEIQSKTDISITVDGSNATSTAFTLINFIHDSNGSAASISYVIKIGLDKSGSAPLFPDPDDMDDFLPSLIDKWMKVEVGGASDSTSLVGKYRKISHFQMGPWANADALCLVTIFLDSVFEKNLNGNSTATATNNAWVSLSEIPFEYVADFWDCNGFLDIDGNVLTQSSILFYYDSDAKKHRQIASYGYDVDTSDTSNAKLIIDAKLFETDPETLSSFDIFPLKNLSEFEEANLTKWGQASYLNTSLGGSYDNIYSTDGTAYAGETHVKAYVPALDTGAPYDQDDTSYEYHNYYLYDYYHILAFEADIDFSKILMEYSSYYLGMNVETHAGAPGDGFTNSPLLIMMRRFIGNSEYVLSQTTGAKYCDEGTLGGVIENIPDWYYLVRTSDNDKSFYYVNTEAAQMRNIDGHSIFALPSITTINQLKSIYKIGLLFQHSAVGPAYHTFTLTIKELSLICKSTGSIKSDLYSIFGGRTYDDTWGTRKTATDLINNPIDLMEHFKRLQNGIEFGDTNESGKSYSPSMLIQTGATTGSYDDATLNTLKTYTPAYQIHDLNDAFTDRQIENICRSFHVCTYVNKTGYECISVLDLTSPAETITFDDIIPGSIGETIEPNASDIYCQPIMNYRFNYGSEKFDKSLLVTNIQETVFDAAYTPGISNTAHNLDVTTHDAEMIWNKARALYEKYRVIESCPKSFSDQKMLVTYEDAVRTLYTKLCWMDKVRQTLAVPYEKGRDYYFSQHVKIKLPHQTCNYTLECVIEEAVISKNKNRVDLQLVLLEDVPTAFFFE